MGIGRCHRSKCLSGKKRSKMWELGAQKPCKGEVEVEAALNASFRYWDPQSSLLWRAVLVSSGLHWEGLSKGYRTRANKKTPSNLGLCAYTFAHQLQATHLQTSIHTCTHAHIRTHTKRKGKVSFIFPNLTDSTLIGKSSQFSFVMEILPSSTLLPDLETSS